MLANLHRVPVLALLFAGFAGCGDSPANPDDQAALFRVQACANQSFTVRITDPQTIARAQELIGKAQQPILSGALARGDGGFNAPYRWHMNSETVEFADFTIELCDGCPQMVEQDLDYWIGTVGRFCPWSSRIVARIG